MLVNNVVDMLVILVVDTVGKERVAIRKLYMSLFLRTATIALII